MRDESIATEDWETTTGIITKDVNEKSLSFSYDAPKTDPPTYSATFSFSTTASRTETIDLDWDYSWFHSWFSVRTRVYLFIENDGSPRTEIELVNTDGGGDKTAYGSESIDLEVGDVYGVSIYGEHFDSSEILRGTFKLIQN